MLERLFYKKRRFYDDDFDWDNYTSDSYARRIKNDIESEFITKVDPADVDIDFDAGRVRLKGASMHPNHQLLLDAVAYLQPASVHEVGCGGGDHVANINRLFPECAVSGGDRGLTQLEMATSRHPELYGKLGVQDITMPYSSHWPKAELVYSQAVIMHIHTAVSHLVALSNMFHCAKSHVLLIENTQCHNFVKDLTALRDAGHLPWQNMQLHIFERNGARGILASNQALDLPVLSSDAQLRKGLKPSQRRLKRSNDDSARGLYGFETP
ncbi:class I SAM-dependent methyltransferase [Roseovarius sp. SCSIO 43702]|uniref:class I SAM-dependent methyltransferase n=1 Tax=Roseovarius sp. SCSIO 43702 TaxID=2823043 RepID=UPI001C72DAA4|nr:class I SAM-dependent methyltransferase [Roseovarius sp. SCSIO 43702]QYX57479.1 class I SAM-dependent methyltransferase [Roseovarius sp. SCSIO 43702]